MARSDRGVELTAAEERLLPLLATTLSLAEIAALIEEPRDEVEMHAASIYFKLGLRTYRAA